jgi:AmmeMemoRadiSam system protein B/AmmeMemoRadiSam system protein A
MGGIMILSTFSDGVSGGSVRPSAIAGSWYTANPEKLSRELKGYLKEVDIATPEGKLAGLIVPHAGYMYSGKAAAYAYKLLEGTDYKRVIIIGPSHRSYFKGASLPPYDSYETPLGTVPVNRGICETFLEHPLFIETDAHTHEHSVEIQLPFLQVVLGDFEFVPILVGEVGLGDIKKIGKVISAVLDERTLLIASSDFTHYGPQYGYVPFADNVKDNLQELDGAAIKKISEFETEGFLTYVKNTGATICGRYPIAVLLEALSDCGRAELLTYYTSGDVLGDYSNSVSYAAIGFFGERADNPGQHSEELTTEEQKTLLVLARKTMELHVRGEKDLTKALAGLEITPVLREKRGAFVTIKERGRLRGCIGYVEPIKPLYQTVMDNAVNASTGDPRFAPLSPEEASRTTIEVSVLTVPKQIGDAGEVIVGRHGLIIEKGYHKGLLLPQVATEYKWTRDQFLVHVCRKAGLEDNAWREGAKLWVFSAQVFSEAE